jgi:hypothetical protein
LRGPVGGFESHRLRRNSAGINRKAAQKSRIDGETAAIGFR